MHTVLFISNLMQVSVSTDSQVNDFLNQACARRPCVPGFLKFLWYACRMCVSVCPPLRELITSGVIWCDIGRVRLVKQVSRFSLLLVTLYV